MPKPPSNSPEAATVGYCRPPRDAQFKPGQSGNPKGRPKGSPNFKTALLKALNQRVSVVVEGRRRSMTKLEAAVTQFANKVASGDARALAQLFGNTEHFEPAAAPAPNQAEAAEDEAIMARMLEQLRQGQEGT